MPQFDPSTFPSQMFWLAVTFALLYIVVSRFAAPRLGEVLEQRQKMIEDDLDHARRLKAEAEAVIQSYQRTLAEARDKARGILREGRAEIAKQAEDRDRAVNAVLGEQIRHGEERIAKAREEALSSVRDIAAAAAAAAAARLLGAPVGATSVDAAVAVAMKEPTT